MTKYAKILWVDLEMTGLDAQKDTILEVAAIVTDWEFNELATFERVIHQSDHVLETMNEWCVTQHGASGLTERVRESDVSSEQVEEQLLAFIDEHFEFDKPVLLAGNSIHMDRRFITALWPKLDERLHYRMLDVSAWKVVFESKYKKRFAKPEEHRALGDIRGSIMELKYYLQKVRM
jgi:oligoribonuclease